MKIEFKQFQTLIKQTFATNDSFLKLENILNKITYYSTIFVLSSMSSYKDGSREILNQIKRYKHKG